MRVREITVRARKIDSRTKKAKTYGKGRTCSLCNAELTTYNKGENCFVHTHAVFVKYRARAKSA